MPTLSITPYLFFAGRCEEALDYYQSAIDANVEMKMRFNESPTKLPDGVLQEGFESKIMHATVRIGETTLMASDGCDDKTRFEGFRLTLVPDNQADAIRYFKALADGGTIDMPLSPTFYSPCYGMVTDRFGVGWMVMVRN